MEGSGKEVVVPFGYRKGEGSEVEVEVCGGCELLHGIQWVREVWDLRRFITLR